MSNHAAVDREPVVKPSKSQEEAEKAVVVKHKVRKDAERLVCD